MGKKALLAILGGVLVLGFQNCNQRGEVALYQNQGKISFSDSDVIQTGEDTDITDNDLNGSIDRDPENTSGTPGVPGAPGSTNSENDSNENLEDQPELMGTCKNKNAELADILLSVKSAKLQGGQGGELKILDDKSEISVENLTLTLEATTDMVISQLRLVLNDAGNKVLFADESLGELKTPSAHTSGLKIKLKESTSLKAGDKVDLTIDSDLLAAVHPAGKKCILHPVLAATLTTN